MSNTNVSQILGAPSVGGCQEAFKTMEIDKMPKCLPKFHVSPRKKDGSHYKKSSLLSIWAALGRHLRATPFNKTFSICDTPLFSEANKTLSSYLKQLVSQGK